MNNDWYSTDSWYAPLEGDKTARDSIIEPAKAKPPKKEKRGITMKRVLALCLMITLLVVASSLAFSRPDVQKGEAFSYDPADDMPESFMDYLDSMYTSTEGKAASVNIPKYTEGLDYELTLNEAEGEALSLQDLYKNSVESIVGIKATKDAFNTGYFWGSGVVLREDGLILTNAHVIDGSDKVTVIMSDDTSYDAMLVGADSISDLAVLKINARGLKSAEFGDSNALSIGDSVAAIGNPLSSNFRLSLTDGIISGIERGMEYNGHVMSLLQTNVAINNGSSGGALFNMYGQVIGITNMKMASSINPIEGIGFAIPSTTVMQVVNDICQNGQVTGRATIGITVGVIPDEIAAYYSIPKGLYIANVIKGTDAYKKGISHGDIITAVNGKLASVLDDVSSVKDTLTIGDEMTFTIWRDGKRFDVSVKLVDASEFN